MAYSCKAGKLVSVLVELKCIGSYVILFLLNFSVVPYRKPSAEIRAKCVLLCYTLLRVFCLLIICNGYSVVGFPLMWLILGYLTMLLVSRNDWMFSSFWTRNWQGNIREEHALVQHDLPSNPDPHCVKPALNYLRWALPALISKSVSHPYRNTDKILIMLISVYLDKRDDKR
jgi:hypothetical protein